MMRSAERILMFVAAAAAILIVGPVARSQAQQYDVVLDIEFRDQTDFETITTIGLGEDFILKVWATTPHSAGISRGGVSVTESPDLGFSANGFALNSILNALPTGSVQDPAPQLLNIGGGTFTGGFAYPGPELWFEAECTANTTEGWMYFTTAQDTVMFAITGQGNTDLVYWGEGELYVTPEPASLSLLALGAAAVFARRRRPS